MIVRPALSPSGNAFGFIQFYRKRVLMRKSGLIIPPLFFRSLVILFIEWKFIKKKSEAQEAKGMQYVSMILLPLCISYLAYELFPYDGLPIICAGITIGLILLHQINKSSKD